MRTMICVLGVLSLAALQAQEASNLITNEVNLNMATAQIQKIMTTKEFSQPPVQQRDMSLAENWSINISSAGRFTIFGVATNRLKATLPTDRNGNQEQGIVNWIVSTPTIGKWATKSVSDDTCEIYGLSTFGCSPSVTFYVTAFVTNSYGAIRLLNSSSISFPCSSTYLEGAVRQTSSGIYFLNFGLSDWKAYYPSGLPGKRTLLLQLDKPLPPDGWIRLAGDNVNFQFNLPEQASTMYKIEIPDQMPTRGNQLFWSKETQVVLFPLAMKVEKAFLHVE